MTLAALQHIIRAAQALAEDRHILILGSASLLASYPELGAPEAPLASTLDADLCPEPFDELTGTMLNEALGENGAYYQRHGYHADILRDSIYTTLPAGWHDRLVPVPGAPTAHALDPHDLAAVKLFVARPKDLQLLQTLRTVIHLDPRLISQRLDLIAKPDRDIIRCAANFQQAFPS